MRKIYITALVLFAFFLGQLPVNSQPFTLLKDINTNVNANAGNSNPGSLTNFNGTLYFSADSRNASNFAVGNEVFKTDGTTDGTVLLKDIGQGGPGNPTNLTVFNGELYFVITDNIHGFELWKTNGTDAGTVMVKDINTTEAGGSHPSNLTVVNNTLFFTADNGATNNGEELWKTDGTEAGTVMVKDIMPGSNTSEPSNLFNLNGVLFFTAVSDMLFFPTPQLWKSDGTEAGTVVAGRPVYRGGNPANLTGLNGTLYYTCTIIYNGNELWKYDDVNGNSQVGGINIDHGTGDSNPASITIFNNQLYFSATDGINGRELWKVDGVGGTPVLVKEINTSAGIGSDPTSLIVLNGSLFFSADDGVNGRELWKSDGTTAGTVMLKDINAIGSGSPVIIGKSGFKFYFAANDGVHGNELWSSDGTADGTVMVQDIEPGSGSSDPADFLEVSGKMYVSVTTSETGRELWFANIPANGPLPLTLLEFKGSVQSDNGILQWKTDNELNTKSFAVERSTDGRHFSAVGNVNAANESGIHYYNYIDGNIKSLGTSIIYYRLRQVDADSKSTYSRVVALTLDKQKSFVMLYPNPVRNDINLTITLAKKDKINWLLTDNNGRVVKNGYYELGTGSSAVVIDGESLSAGYYLLRLNSELLQQTIKIVKQ
jgi:ELWxxDGT repeat protein